MNIQPEWRATFELVRDSLPVMWRAVAKDGLEVPASQSTAGPSRRALWPGETFDAEFAPTLAGVYHVRMISEKGKRAYDRVLRVRP